MWDSILSFFGITPSSVAKATGGQVTNLVLQVDALDPFGSSILPVKILGMKTATIATLGGLVSIAFCIKGGATYIYRIWRPAEPSKLELAMENLANICSSHESKLADHESKLADHENTLVTTASAVKDLTENQIKLTSKVNSIKDQIKDQSDKVALSAKEILGQIGQLQQELSRLGLGSTETEASNDAEVDVDVDVEVDAAKKPKGGKAKAA